VIAPPAGGWLLAVDTALRERATVVAAAPDGRVLERWEGSEAVDRLLIAELRRLFRRPGPLLGVLAGIGPGSFTGLRVGVAACLGAAHARDCPLRTVPSLLITATTVDPGPFSLLVVHPAGRGAHHAQEFHAGEDGWIPTAPAWLAPRGEAPPADCGGRGRVVLRGDVEPAWRASAAGRSAPQRHPVDRALARLAARTWRGAARWADGDRDLQLDYGAARPGSPWS